MRRTKRIQSGLGMLEIMITLFLVSLGLLVVMASFVAISKSGKYSERMNTATTLARMEMERVRNKTYDNIRSSEGVYSEYPDYPDFRHSVVVRDVGTAKEVVLRIYFEHDRRRAELRTYMANM
jgi:Tfp pilus assembly protein PilV